MFNILTGVLNCSYLKCGKNRTKSKPDKFAFYEHLKCQDQTTCNIFTGLRVKWILRGRLLHECFMSAASNSLDFDKELFSCNYDYSDPPVYTHININSSLAPNTIGHLNDALSGWSKPKVARKNKGLEWIIHQAPDNITHGWVRHILHAPRIWISTP